MSASPTHMALTGGQDPGALGLNVVYTPDNGHKADIVFIHGLGGSSRMTWSKHKKPGLFWPLTFLPLEPDICLARILSFGYDADFTNGSNATNVILDFAKTLLYNLKYYTDAYMQGQNDPEYENIVKAISAIIFLSTPHRGTNLANVLNRILQSTPVTNSKPFISELTRNSSTLQKLNEQFRHIAPKLKIVSFYETQPTSIGPKSARARVMVLERDSSLLGYPGETSNPLNADHHGVCKYESPHDPNYITVRNVLKSLVSKSISKSQSGSQSVPRRRRSRDLKAILAIAEFPNTDYIFFRDQWVQGTNQWIQEERRFVDWLNPHTSSHQILWLKGAAARGKSVLSSFIINCLIERDFCCQYFFVRFADRRKRTLSFLLRSIAYQIAQQLPEFLQKVAEVESEAVDFEAANPRTIWDRIFRSILFKLSPSKTLYWVIDGLDEADNPKALISLLSDLAGSATPIRVLLVSRDTTEIAAGLEHTPDTIFQETIIIEGHVDDLRCYVDRELILPGSKSFRDDIIQRILHEAQDNFLWVRLAVEKINSCHTHSAVEQAFHEFPRGMEAIYDRMAATIAEHQSSADTALASVVLQCVTCAFRALTIEELLQALEGDTHEFLDIQESIKNVCSGFVVIDNDGNVAMIHETAREYLLGAIRRPFQILASELRLRILIQASKNLLGYVNKRKSQLPTDIGRRDVVELEQAETWAVDFVKIIGKFGAILRRNPTTIHETIAPFCPHNSAIYQQFGRTKQRNLMVSGISTQTWDDSLARLSFGFGTYASFISTAGNHVAVLAASGKASGKVSLFDISLFEETATSPIRHGERTYMMELNSSGTLLVTYGYRTTKIWEISTGECVATVPNPATRTRPLVIAFVNNNKTLLVGSDDKQLRSLEINELSPTWHVVANFEEEELEGHFLNAASYMALSDDGNLMAVAYRGHPLSAWEVEGPYHIGHCWRARKEVARGEVAAAEWLPHSPQVLGLYNDGVVFRWDPYGGEPEEIFTGASVLTVSGDGNLFATGDVRGAIKIYTTNTFHLIYQLASQDAILGLAFSADHRRIYDVRGYYGNTWEPAALVRYAESAIKGTDTEGESESSSQESITPVHTSRRIDAITVLAASPNGQYYCYGTESGRVILLNTTRDETTELHTSRGFLSIEQVAWSHDGRYICFADSGKKVFVMVVRMNASGSDDVAQHHFEVSLKTLTDGSIQQLLFQPDSSHLCIATSATLCTVSLESASVVRSIPAPEHDCKWITHPQNPALILGFGQNSVVILSWDLNDLGTYRIERSIEPDTSALSDQEAAARTVERILVTSDNRHILVQMSRSTKSKLKEFLYFATSSLSTSASIETQPGDHRQIVVPMPLPEGLASQIGLALSFLKRDRLLFLSRTFSICSWEIPSDAKLAQPSQVTKQQNHEKKEFSEIFALPADWVSKDCLELCMIWLQERSLLCPRNGEVAVVRCSSFL
ncbi:uncharacterized protein J4E84_002705 [Alternaria hordeiaustralica]|uniref:uncharacterized protein n=1 Tax=Alternaria hordeiaustralica TaxID=1187925 RepID=UPI0020C5AAB6|nr:uncharacterized protein J4E84_002705 [Alternaria hordeiaustralica]KAI4694124.1 hypothetical protein J4E84_002705 [Alternaria hordeiaustralica]